MFKDIGCSNVKITFFQPAVTDKEQKIAALLSAKNCGPQYIAAGLATNEEVENMISLIDTEIVMANDVIWGNVEWLKYQELKLDS